MIIAMSCTENWYHYLVVDLYSLLECTKDVRKIYLLVQTENIEQIPYLKDLKNKYDVEFKLIDLNKYIEKNLSKNSPNKDTIYSDFCFARLMLADFVEEDKVLYIDTDAIVRKDISNVWKYDISEYYVAGVKDYGILNDNTLERLGIDDKYINSGFVIFNLKKIREEKIKEKWFKIINKQELKYPDQDALNLICHSSELYLPSMYNSAMYGEYITLEVLNNELTKVYHYAGPKEDWVVDRFHAEEWYDAEEKFYNEFGWYKYKE